MTLEQLQEFEERLLKHISWDTYNRAGLRHVIRDIWGDGYVTGFVDDKLRTED